MATTLTNETGGGVFDYAVMFKSSGNLTKTSTVPSSGIKIRGTAVDGSAARVVFPTTPGASATRVMQTRRFRSTLTGVLYFPMKGQVQPYCCTDGAEPVSAEVGF